MSAILQGVTSIRIALANLPFPSSREDSVTRARVAVAAAAEAGAAIVCFPECYVPGYRATGKGVAPPDAEWLASGFARIGDAARAAHLTVVLGTERVVDSGVHASGVVIGPDGAMVGTQDKVQIDPSEEGLYVPGSERRVFAAAGVIFGVTICHEGWRYPETVRWAARRGAQVVFHQAFHEAEPGGYRPTTFADPGRGPHDRGGDRAVGPRLRRHHLSGADLAPGAARDHQGGSRRPSGARPAGQSALPGHHLRHTPETVYAHIYAARGDSENRLKELHHALVLGRTSCTRLWANQLRVLLSAAAYVLTQTLHLAAAATSLAVAQAPRLRQALLTIGVQVTRPVRRLVLHLPRSHPEQAAWQHVARALGAT